MHFQNNNPKQKGLLNLTYVFWFFVLLFKTTTENLEKHKELIGKANKELEELRIQKDALQNERKWVILFFWRSASDGSVHLQSVFHATLCLAHTGFLLCNGNWMWIIDMTRHAIERSWWQFPTPLVAVL